MQVLVFRFLSFQVCLFTQKIEAGRCHDRIRGENFIWLGKRLHRKQTVKSDGNNLDQPKFSLYMWRLQSHFIIWCGGGSLSELFYFYFGYKQVICETVRQQLLLPIQLNEGLMPSNKYTQFWDSLSILPFHQKMIGKSSHIGQPK